MFPNLIYDTTKDSSSTMELNLDSFSLSQLLELKEQIEQKIQLLEEKQRVTDLDDEVEKQGYSVRKESVETKFPHFLLKVNIDVKTWDKEDRDPENWHIKGLSDEQDPWFDRFSPPPYEERSWIKRCPGDLEFDIDDIVAVDEDWKYGDWDDPYWTTGPVYVYFYYKPGVLPEEGKEVEILNEDGEILSLSVKDSIIYLNGKPGKLTTPFMVL